LAKGVLVDPFPKYWTKWTKITEDMNEEEIERINFDNSIIIDKRPYFFKYLYKDYNKQNNNYNNNFENYCITNLGKHLNEILMNPFGEKETSIRDKYLRFSPLLDSFCTMNRICHYMEENIKELKYDMGEKEKESTAMILKSHQIKLDKEKLKKLYTLYKKYKSDKRNFANIRNTEGEEIYKTLDQYSKAIRTEAFLISNNIQELANLAVIICYEYHPADSKSFAWGVFGEGIVRNVEENRQEQCYIPNLNRNGEIEYLGYSYSSKEIYPLGEEY